MKRSLFSEMIIFFISDEKGFLQEKRQNGDFEKPNTYYPILDINNKYIKTRNF